MNTDRNYVSVGKGPVDRSSTIAGHSPRPLCPAPAHGTRVCRPMIEAVRTKAVTLREAR